LREEHGLRVFENRVLRIFGPKREEDGLWRKLHNDEPVFFTKFCYIMNLHFVKLDRRPENHHKLRTPARAVAVCLHAVPCN
jgi:hypothetical protein